MVPLQHARREPIHDVHPLTGISFEVFYSDRTLETFGRDGAGWFWWPRRRGFSPDGPATGPFATSYAAYRHAMNTALTQGPDHRECWYFGWYDAISSTEYI
jgi:hypothetical protein